MPKTAHGWEETSDSIAFLEIRSLAKAYHARPVLESISLDIYRGEFLTILGESGSGKTTLLRILAGFEEADAGDALLEGKSLLKLTPARRPINTVFQNYALFPHMNVFQNIAYGLRVRRVAGPEIKRRVDAALALVRMENFALHFPRQISGGQKQRVSLARAVVNEPKMVLLDEPLSALDANLRAEMQRELKLLQQQIGITFLLVTHDQEEAMSISDRIVLLHRGRIEQCGTPREIYFAPRTIYAASFIGKSNLIRGKVQNGVASSGPFRLTVNLPDGSVVFSLRPECIHLRGAEDGSSESFNAVVEAQQFQGSSVLVSLRCAEGTRLSARLPAQNVPVVGSTGIFCCKPQDFIPVTES